LFDISRKLGLQTVAGMNLRAVRSWAPWLSLLLLFGLAGSRTAKATELQNGPVTSVGPGPQFAIADLDGDLRPDSASIQVGQNASSMSTYWIQVHVAAGLRSFPVVAPAFGLIIKARYVNGRNAADLVLATAWSRQPVAIFLNDGHGNFSPAKPTLTGSFNDSNTNLDSSANLATVTAGVPPQSGAGICAEERKLLDDRSRAGLIPPSSSGFPVSPFSVSHSGRAPPSAVSCP
jgi:hypothetical protein